MWRTVCVETMVAGYVVWRLAERVLGSTDMALNMARITSAE